MVYIDGFVAAVPTDNKEAYRDHAEIASLVFKKYGALKLVECWGDDVRSSNFFGGELTSFPKAVQCEDDETVVFSWLIWPSKEVRDKGMPQAVADPRMDPKTSPWPFDAKRLLHGGFEVLLDV